jgi:hypothetical protein
VYVEKLMIISASRRTDIPAFYSDWFMNRIRQGYCVVPHPFNRKRIYQVSLRPDDVTSIVFWSKNPAPLIPHLNELDDRGYRYYFLFTLNDYPLELEPNLPDISDRLKIFRELANTLGSSRVVWRYDPIIVSNLTNWDFHRRTFERLCHELRGSTERVITSLVQFYAKTRRRLGSLVHKGYEFDQNLTDRNKVRSLLADMSAIAQNAGMETMICASDEDFSDVGVVPSRCIDGELLTRLWGIQGPWSKDKGQRPACGCTVAKDIGVADTCLHHCPYCYATISEKAAVNNFTKHNSGASCLVALPDEYYGEPHDE